jgi:hypothetical protein
MLWTVSRVGDVGRRSLAHAYYAALLQRILGRVQHSAHEQYLSSIYLLAIVSVVVANYNCSPGNCLKPWSI